MMSSSPPEGYELMSDNDAVKQRLNSFGGAIAAANYTDDMIAAGFDSLDNMAFSSSELREAVNRILPGHAIRIARDAATMQASIVSKSDKMTSSELSSPKEDDGYAVNDAMKIAGKVPSFPAGTGAKPVSRARVEDWLDQTIAWARVWSPNLSDGLIMKRDNDKKDVCEIRSSCNVHKQHEIYLGSQIMSTIGYNEKIYITKDVKDRFMGLEIVDVLVGRFMRSSVEHKTKMLDKFTQQNALANIRELSARLAEWRTLRARLEDLGEPQSETAQMGSLGKVVAKFKAVQDARNAAEVIKGKQLDVTELLLLLDNIAGQVDAKGEAYNNPNPNPNPNPNQKQNNNNTTNAYLTNNNKQDTKDNPIQPVAMKAAKSGKPCLHWNLTKLGAHCNLGENCPHTHDPLKRGSDDPQALQIAKSIKCRNPTPCRFGDACVFGHE